MQSIQRLLNYDLMALHKSVYYYYYYLQIHISIVKKSRHAETQTRSLGQLLHIQHYMNRNKVSKHAGTLFTKFTEVTNVPKH